MYKQSNSQQQFPWENMKTQPPRCPKNKFPEILILNGQSRVKINTQTYIVACGFVTNFCRIFSKGTQPFDFIKRNVI